MSNVAMQGWTVCDGVPEAHRKVRRSRFAALVDAFLASGEECVCRDFENAEREAASMKNYVRSHGLACDVTRRGGTVFLFRAKPHVKSGKRGARSRSAERAEPRTAWSAADKKWLAENASTFSAAALAQRLKVRGLEVDAAAVREMCAELGVSAKKLGQPVEKFNKGM